MLALDALERDRPRLAEVRDRRAPRRSRARVTTRGSRGRRPVPATRAAIITCRPKMSSPAEITSPVCTPTRIAHRAFLRRRARPRRAPAARRSCSAARAGRPGNVSMNPSPWFFTSCPDHLRTLRRTISLCWFSTCIHAVSPIDGRAFGRRLDVAEHDRDRALEVVRAEQLLRVAHRTAPPRRSTFRARRPDRRRRADCVRHPPAPRHGRRPVRRPGRASTGSPPTGSASSIVVSPIAHHGAGAQQHRHLDAVRRRGTCRWCCRDLRPSRRGRAR